MIIPIKYRIASVDEQREDASGILILFIARAIHQLPIRVEFWRIAHIGLQYTI